MIRDWQRLAQIIGVGLTAAPWASVATLALWLAGCALPAGPLAPEGVELYGERSWGEGGSAGTFGGERSRWSQDTLGVRVYFSFGQDGDEVEPEWAPE